MTPSESFLHSVSFGAIIALGITGYPSGLLAQNTEDFIISDSGRRPSVAYDLKNGIYVSWDNLDDAIHLKHLDFLGNVLGDCTTFPKTSGSMFPRVAVNPKYIVVVWDDMGSRIFDYTYISGSIIHNNSTDTNIHVMLNNSGGDYIRGSPDIAFLNDTTLIAAWCGNGDSTPVVRSGIYGRIVSTSGNKMSDEFLITDHIRDTTDNYLPRIVSRGDNSFFIVVWVDNSSGHFNLYGRKFGLSGLPQGSSFLISDDSAVTDLYYYGVAKDTSGNFRRHMDCGQGQKVPNGMEMARQEWHSANTS